MSVRSARDTFERVGLLLLSDNERPALAQLIAGERIAGSWWGHPQGKLIFNTGEAWEGDPDVTSARLVDGKVTFVHRRLFGALVAIGTEGAAWQTNGLTTDASDLLAQVQADGRVGSDSPDLGWDAKRRKAAFGQLGERLLTAVWDEHTARGSHRTVAERWSDWARSRGLRDADLPEPDAARAAIESAITALGGGKAPWQRKYR